MHRNIRADRGTLYVMYEANFTFDSADTVVNKITFLGSQLSSVHRIPHRTKVFTGINVRKICDSQNRERFKPTKN